VKAACQGEERPLKSSLLAKSADFPDKLRRRQRRSTGKRCHFEDCASVYRFPRYRADRVPDGAIQIAFREKSVVEKTKAGRAEHLVTMIEKGDDPGRKGIQPSAISSRVDILDKLLGRMLANIVFGENCCRAHLDYRPPGLDQSGCCR
jgi:hypothetical protein